MNADLIRDLTAFRLANEADVACPDAPDSAGAVFLANVRDCVVELIERNPDGDRYFDDALVAIADDAPDHRTHARWVEFVDLAAYNEDIEDFGTPDDLTQAAGIALYVIAERLARRLIELADVEDDSDGQEEES